MIYVLIFMLMLSSWLYLKYVLQKVAHKYRLELANEVHKLNNDPNTPERLLDLSFIAVKVSFDNWLMFKVAISALKNKKRSSKLGKFSGPYNSHYHEIIQRVGKIATLNSPLISLIFVYYFFIKGSHKIEEKIVDYGMHHNEVPA